MVSDLKVNTPRAGDGPFFRLAAGRKSPMTAHLQAGTPPRTRTTEWFDDDGFWRVMYPFLFSDRRFEETLEQVEQTVALLNAPGRAVLDLCCGPGRFSVPLSKSPKKKRQPKRVLALPDLEQAKAAVLNSLTSASGQRTYDHAIREFVAWYCSEPRQAAGLDISSKEAWQLLKTIRVVEIDLGAGQRNDRSHRGARAPPAF
jgi:hypothetical protein